MKKKILFGLLLLLFLPFAACSDSAEKLSVKKDAHYLATSGEWRVLAVRVGNGLGNGSCTLVIEKTGGERVGVGGLTPDWVNTCSIIVKDDVITFRYLENENSYQFYTVGAFLEIHRVSK
jgi:hypothetical protein